MLATASAMPVLVHLVMLDWSCYSLVAYGTERIVWICRIQIAAGPVVSTSAPDYCSYDSAPPHTREFRIEDKQYTIYTTGVLVAMLTPNLNRLTHRQCPTKETASSLNCALKSFRM
jgi:hypothetical protein